MKREKKELFKKRVFSFFKSSPKRKFNYRQILNLIPDSFEKHEIKAVLFLLEKEKKIKQLNKISYLLNSKRKWKKEY